MATADDVRGLALALPGTQEGTSFGHTCWKAGGTNFAWIRPFTKADIRRDGEPPPGDLLAVRVADEGEKAALVAGEPAWCFALSHFDGFPAVMVQLDAVPLDRLAELLADAWDAVAPDGTRAAPA